MSTVADAVRAAIPDSPVAMFPYREAVLSVPESINVFMGGGRGGAKTRTALVLALRHCEQHGEGASVLYIRHSYKAGSESEEDFLGIVSDAYEGVRYNKAEHVFHLPGGARVEFGQLDDSTSYRKFQGRSYTLLICDELGDARDMRWVNLLKSNLRSPAGVPVRCVFVANPGGTQHVYLRENFVSRAPAWDPYRLEGETWVNAPSTFRDNPFLPAGYVDKLRAAAAGDEHLFRAWAEGSWDVLRGAFFGDVLDQRVHMLPAAWPWPVDGRWKAFISLDWGSSAPACCFICLRAPGDVGPFAKDSLILLDEISTAMPDNPNEGLRWPPSKLGEVILERCRHWRVHPAGVGDDAAGLQPGNSLFALLGEMGISLQRPRKERVQGWSKLRQLMHNTRERNGQPGFYASARCGYFWRTVPSLPRDEHRPEDVDTAAPDHAADAARYAALHLGQYVRISSVWTGTY
jgi:hypothetical protein